jgi:hypothetical protein
MVEDFEVYVDRHGRRFVIRWEDDVGVYYAGKCIGKIGIDFDDDGPLLWSIDVDEEFRRVGLATEMMRRVAQIYGSDIRKPALRAPGGKNAHSHEYYTQDGAALVKKCIALGILDAPAPAMDD